MATEFSLDKLAALEALEALEKLATPEPWFQDEGSVGSQRIKDTPRISVLGDLYIAHVREEDAEYIAAIRNAAPALFAAIREQGEEIERMRKELAAEIDRGVELRGMLECGSPFVDDEEITRLREDAEKWRLFASSFPGKGMDGLVSCFNKELARRRIEEAKALNPSPQPDAKGE